MLLGGHSCDNAGIEACDGRGRLLEGVVVVIVLQASLITIIILFIRVIRAVAYLGF